MQAPTGEKAKARDLLLAAASKVFAEEGLKGATTREIANVAGVNESTLFRIFQTKEGLLQAVVEKISIELTHDLEDPAFYTGGLRENLGRYAESYNRILMENEPLIRVFIGEAKRQPDASQRIIRCIGQSVREKLVAYFEQAQQHGEIRADINPAMAASLFTGMILSGMLRRGFIDTGYSPEEYLQGCVEVLIDGIKHAG